MPTDSERLTTVSIGAAVFLSGAVLLGLEIAASRVVAPFFGTSLFVWGSLIGIVLTGLSIGYWLGGVLADRFPTPYLLVAMIALGAGFVALIPVIDEAVLEWVVEWDPGPRANPVVATIVLFGLASVVLGSVSPIAVKLVARSFERLGRTAGRLFAVSTAGSIAGTFATAFWLIPELGTNQVIAVGAFVLLVAATGVALSSRLFAASAGLAAAAAASLVLVASLAPEQGGTLRAAQGKNWSPLYRAQETKRQNDLDPASVDGGGFTIKEAKDTRYHRLIVADDADSRYLRFDSSFQSGMYLDDPFKTRFRYTDYLSLGLAYNPGAKRILFIGLGGGSAVKQMWRDFPELELTAVELDQDVVDAAHRWFAVPRDERIEIDVADGRRFLVTTDETWDAIVIDAFYADSIPFHLATREFMQLVHSRLAPDGVVVTNMIGAITGDSSRLVRSLARTYREVFPTLSVHPVILPGEGRSPDEVRNVILVATDVAEPTEAVLAERWRELRATSATAPDLTAAIRDRWNTEITLADVPVLTDDYAPTDSLLLLFG